MFILYSIVNWASTEASSSWTDYTRSMSLLFGVNLTCRSSNVRRNYAIPHHDAPRIPELTSMTSLSSFLLLPLLSFSLSSLQFSCTLYFFNISPRSPILTFVVPSLLSYSYLSSSLIFAAVSSHLPHPLSLSFILCFSLLSVCYILSVPSAHPLPASLWNLR